MLIRFVRGWGNYRDGQTVEFNEGPAEILIARGLAELVADQPAAQVFKKAHREERRQPQRRGA